MLTSIKVTPGERNATTLDVLDELLGSFLLNAVLLRISLRLAPRRNRIIDELESHDVWRGQFRVVTRRKIS